MRGERREGNSTRAGDSLNPACHASTLRRKPIFGDQARRAWSSRRVKPANAGFTLIELIVVFAIIALLVALAVPRYFGHIERAKEATLKQDLSVMRDAIDKFYADKGRYPDALEELAKERYVREIPADPFTESASTWVVLAPPSDAKAKGQVYDVKSGAEGKSADGRPYADW